MCAAGWDKPVLLLLVALWLQVFLSPWVLPGESVTCFWWLDPRLSPDTSVQSCSRPSTAASVEKDGGVAGMGSPVPG